MGGPNPEPRPPNPNLCIQGEGANVGRRERIPREPDLPPAEECGDIVGGFPLIFEPFLIAVVAHTQPIVGFPGVAADIVLPSPLPPESEGAAMAGGPLIAGVAHPGAVISAIWVAASVDLGRDFWRWGIVGITPTAVARPAHPPCVVGAVVMAAGVGFGGLVRHGAVVVLL